jgi:hypothetical protein
MTAAIVDASGRVIAPPQTEIAPRAMGPWDTNGTALKVVCCYCEPWHVMSDGIEPASHGACPTGIARFEAGAR